MTRKDKPMRSASEAPDKAKYTPKEIHIFADEDHAHLRPKKSAIVPIVTVTEGIDTSNYKRHKTIEPIHFQGYGVNVHTFVKSNPSSSDSHSSSVRTA